MMTIENNKLSEAKIRSVLRQVLEEGSVGDDLFLSSSGSSSSSSEFSKDKIQNEIFNNLASSIRDYEIFTEVSSVFGKRGLRPTRRDLFEHVKSMLSEEFKGNLSRSDYYDLEWGSRNSPTSFFMNDEFIQSFIGKNIKRKNSK